MVVCRKKSDLLHHKSSVQPPCIGPSDGSSLLNHNIIQMQLECLYQTPSSQVVTSRKLRNISVEQFRNNLSNNLDGPNFSNTSDVNALATTYNRALSQTLDTHAPLVTRSVPTRPPCPSFNDELRCMKQEKSRAERTMRSSKHNINVNKMVFEDACHSFNYHIEQATSSHLCQKVQEAGRNQKELNKITRSLLGASNTTPLLDAGSPSELAERFSDSFISKITIIRDSLQKTNASELEVNPTKLSAWEPKFEETPLTYFRSIIEEETNRLIMKSPSKSCELDPVTTTPLKQCVNEISPLVTKLINTSTANTVVPDIFKHAIVRPLLKKANLDQNILKNYHPVSNLLCFISKVCERVISTQLREDIELHQLTHPLQSTYSKKHSTETALLKV